MILRRLHLHPFAGTADHEFRFEFGLNVVLGPNEAGKTTLGNAIRRVLFVSTKLTKRETASEVAPYLPLGGGDTIRVSVDLDVGGETWKLAKHWGGGSSASELLLPNGGVISDSETVDSKLAELLGLSQGTWEHALFARQGGVASSLKGLRDGSAVDDLNEVLRRAVFETDGVSLETLAESIDVRWKDAFGRWDRDLNRPEANRGLENPWRNLAGRIVEAWYDQERAKGVLQEAEAYYHELDDLTVRLSTAASDSETLKRWVETHAAVAADAEKRAVLDGKLAQVVGTEKTLRDISQQWPVAVAKAGDLETRAAGLSQRAKELSTELQQTEAWEAATLNRHTLAQAFAVQGKIDEAAEALGDTTKVEAEQIASLESLDKEGDLLRARLDAAKLGVIFKARRAIDIDFQAGVDPEESRSLADGESLEFTAGARAVIRHSDWELEVRSGDADVAAEEAHHGEIAEKGADLLKTMGVEDLAGARKLQSEYQEKTSQISALEGQLADLLGEESLETLQAEVEKASEAGTPNRKAAEVAEERGQVATDAQNLAEQAAEQRERVETWKEAYESPEALLDQLVERRGELKQLEKEIAALRPLPEGVDDVQAFLGEFREKKQELDDLKSAYNELLVEKAALDGRAPAVEPAEAAEHVAEAEILFHRARREGESIDRIRRDFAALRAEMDEGTLEPWLKHLGEVVSPLTQKRYQTIDLADGAFARDGEEVNIPFEVLSGGTSAILGLAVRLSMARWFLEGRGGFLVLDDPLVDLDPERQQSAAAVLKKFAEEKQVILLTCHPAHAEILGGEAIAL